MILVQLVQTAGILKYQIAEYNGALDHMGCYGGDSVRPTE